MDMVGCGKLLAEVCQRYYWRFCTSTQRWKDKYPLHEVGSVADTHMCGIKEGIDGSSPDNCIRYCESCGKKYGAEW